jgi:NADH-quinone oxidoreductase subunit N
MIAPFAEVQAPVIDYEALSPLMATLGGSIVVLMAGLLRGRFVQTVLVPLLTVVSLLTAIGLVIWVWEPGDTVPIIEGALDVDTLALGLSILFYAAGLVCVGQSLSADAPREAGSG